MYNDKNVPESNESTPEVLEDTYFNMEMSLSNDGEGTEYAKVTKRLCDANGVLIFNINENPI